MDIRQHRRFILPDKTYASILKRDITGMAINCGLSKNQVGKVNIIVSEMVSNLVKYTPNGGELLARCLEAEPGGLEIICLDSGPGMHDPQRMLLDGVSTAGTAGEGLGAIKRQSDMFDLYSQPGNGTVILSRVYKNGGQAADANHTSCFEVGAVAVPMANQELSGDGWAVLDEKHNCYVIVLDGLGHGPKAHEASQQAVQVFARSLQHDPAAILRQVHEGLRHTRGAVGLVACIDSSKQHINLCGIGNIAGKVFTADDGPLITVSKSVLSYNGTLGHNIPARLHTQALEWNNAKLLVLHSDGLKSRWAMSIYPNLHRHNPTTIAAVLYRDHSRQTDDALVVVVRSKA
ncbi:SpoIIE family protein phosphatase [Pontibacter sp. 172403-2]|uniref:SpoIIE family protein phosphatase n=1 Tax=Pontibacter rufus TaxID=2791028 RepID=UPI0018AFF389|nr:SpoIIE family protein phosphatase [Pontibacter sp. 172403-2]MBF9255437.1 SpoIIE family protein phosphatase [Pontibacter sp. 172403-2]